MEEINQIVATMLESLDLFFFRYFIIASQYISSLK